MKVVCGLGNPGSEYADTRHNVGWWILDRAREEWGFPPFRRVGPARASEARLGGHDVLLLKPITYMNRSGAALAPLTREPDFDFRTDLLVLVDDAALDTGRVRFRPSGSSGGHNGLRSVEAALRSQEYARLRVGVGTAPGGVDMADWVLSAPEPEEADRLRDLVPELVEAVATWVEHGVDVAATRFNR